MKHVLPVMLVFGLMGATAARAQSPSVGVRVGINAATLSSDEGDFDPKIKTGIVAGLFVEVPVTDVFSFQPEFLYSMEGAKFTDGGDSAKLHLDFFQVPLLARIKLGKGSPAALLIGPSVGFRTKAEIKAGDETQDIKDDVKSTNIGLVTGIGINAGRAVFDARYTWGLTNLDDGENPDKVKSRVFSASVGVRF